MLYTDALMIARRKKSPYVYVFEYSDDSFYVGSSRKPNISRLVAANRKDGYVKNVSIFFMEAGEVRDREKSTIKELVSKGVHLRNKVLYNYLPEPDTAKTYSLRYTAENIALRAKIRAARGY